MARRKQSRGKCAFCGREMTKGGLSRHLKTCPQRQEAMSAAAQGPGQEMTLYHLQAQDAWWGDFWWLCFECMYELDEPGTLCDRHAEEHPHQDYGEPVPLVNSPRVGMCGYSGPAEPPY